MEADLNDSVFLNEKAIEYYQAGQLQDSIRLFKLLLVKFPNDADLLTNLGTISLLLGELSESELYNQHSLAINANQSLPNVHLGIVFQQQHRYSESLDSYDRAIVIDPYYAGAHYNRGNLLQEIGSFEESVHSYDLAVGINPGYASAYCNRGLVLNALNRSVEAIASYDQAIIIKQDYAEAYVNRGIAFFDIENYDASIASYDQAILIDPNYLEAFINRGIASQGLDDFESALASYDHALVLSPANAEANYNRGNVLNDLARYQEAIDSYDVAISIRQNYHEAMTNKGISQHALLLFDQAIQSFESAISFDSTSALAHFNLGVSQVKLQLNEQAVESFEQCRLLDANYPDAAYNLGNVLTSLNRHAEALVCQTQAVQENDSLAAAHYNLANTLSYFQRYEEAILSYSEAIELNSLYFQALSNRGSAFCKLQRYEEAIADFDSALVINPEIDYLYGFNLHTKMHICDWRDFDSNVSRLKQAINSHQKVVSPFPVLALLDDPEVQQKACAIYNQYQLYDAIVPTLMKPYKSHHKIRVAYFSADYHNHATMHLMAELFENHDQDKFEFIGFAYGSSNEDIWRKRAKSSFFSFIDVRHLTDHAVVLIARLLEIDIAIDLKGFTLEGRPGIFAERVAPIQVSYLGYPGTMASPYIDYMIVDNVLIADKKRQFYSEAMVYLPSSYQANASLVGVATNKLTRLELGLPTEGVVFCSFNNNYKITPATFDSWMRILHQVEGSVLWLYANTQSAMTNLKKEAVIRGIDAQRLVFASHVAVEDHLARLPLADLFLDTLPYNAHTTASDALRMGLPLLTCEGSSFASRVAASLLMAVDMSELIAQTYSEYETLAIYYGNDSQALDDLKAKLQSHLKTSDLFNVRLFAKHIETAYQEMNRRFCAGEALRNIEIL